MNFLFWNLAKKNLLDELTLLAEELDLAIIILSECDIQEGLILSKLNKSKNDYYYSPGYVCEKIKLFTRFKSQYSTPVTENVRWTIRKIELPIDEEFMILALHLPSKVNSEEEDLKQEAELAKEALEKACSENKCDRALIIGDFNMNPFERGMVTATGFHSVKDKNVAVKKERTINGRVYRYFYNPMWGFLGDLGKGETNGTHYRSSNNHICYYWNIYDQVLISPEMISFFDFDSLRIISTFDGSSMLNKNEIINKKKYSDHLPIFFSLNI